MVKSEIWNIKSWTVPFSGVTGRGQSAPPPETSDREIFLADVSGKKRQGKKGKGVKIEKKRRKIVKKKGGKLEMEGGKLEMKGGKLELEGGKLEMEVWKVI